MWEKIQTCANVEPPPSQSQPVQKVQVQFLRQRIQWFIRFKTTRSDSYWLLFITASAWLSENGLSNFFLIQAWNRTNVANAKKASPNDAVSSPTSTKFMESNTNSLTSRDGRKFTSAKTVDILHRTSGDKSKIMTNKIEVASLDCFFIFFLLLTLKKGSCDIKSIDAFLDFVFDSRSNYEINLSVLALSNVIFFCWRYSWATVPRQCHIFSIPLPPHLILISESITSIHANTTSLHFTKIWRWMRPLFNHWVCLTVIHSYWPTGPVLIEVLSIKDNLKPLAFKFKEAKIRLKSQHKCAVDIAIFTVCCYCESF